MTPTGGGVSPIQPGAPLGPATSSHHHQVPTQQQPHQYHSQPAIMHPQPLPMASTIQQQHSLHQHHHHGGHIQQQPSPGIHHPTSQAHAQQHQQQVPGYQMHRHHSASATMTPQHYRQQQFHQFQSPTDEYARSPTPPSTISLPQAQPPVQAAAQRQLHQQFIDAQQLLASQKRPHQQHQQHYGSSSLTHQPPSQHRHQSQSQYPQPATSMLPIGPTQSGQHTHPPISQHHSSVDPFIQSVPPGPAYLGSQYQRPSPPPPQQPPSSSTNMPSYPAQGGPVQQASRSRQLINPPHLSGVGPPRGPHLEHHHHPQPPQQHPYH